MVSYYQSLILVVGVLLTQHSAFSLTLLGPKSTASQVLSYLEQNDQLAPYVREGGTAVVTGGSSGIGAETVKTLAKTGLNVVLCARNIESAAEVKDALPPSVQDRVEVQYMDLSYLGSVRDAADAICSKYDTIDCLINNAGVMALQERETSVDGIEMQWGTNHVGHHYLTKLLLPNMSEDHGRVVTVASTAHKIPSKPVEDWESKTSYSPWGAYGISKLSNILFAKQLLAETTTAGEKKIESVSLHPGVIASPLWKHTLPSFLQPVAKLFSNKSIEQGAATSIYCALSRHVVNGGYYDDCAVAEPSVIAKNKDQQEALWKYTEDLLAEKGFRGVDESKEEAVLTNLNEQ